MQEGVYMTRGHRRQMELHAKLCEANRLIFALSLGSQGLLCYYYVLRLIFWIALTHRSTTLEVYCCRICRTDVIACVRTVLDVFCLVDVVTLLSVVRSAALCATSITKRQVLVLPGDDFVNSAFLQ